MRNPFTAAGLSWRGVGIGLLLIVLSGFWLGGGISFGWKTKSDTTCTAGADSGEKGIFCSLPSEYGGGKIFIPARLLPS